ncbi:hypothetical protein EXU57_15205 [Segetibacter sp. 3557_3]|uniref:hypothetical protein n=1 Tax=Segetibacter sp. 3557_3 TaxID=2547429 RepID=UPI00105855F5|nr:hypothetical protein EXU57_15205 [Segetibacter sp. 3557_3]
MGSSTGGFSAIARLVHEPDDHLGAAVGMLMHLSHANLDEFLVRLHHCHIAQSSG